MAGFFFTSEKITKLVQFNNLILLRFAKRMPPSGINLLLLDMFKRVSDLTGGFDALQKVIGGAFTISLNLVVGAIQGITLGVQYAQLAWEKSMFGGKDANKIKELQSNIDETKEKLSETGESISNAGKQIKDNFVEAVQEVGSLAKGVAETTQKAINEIDVNAAKERQKTGSPHNQGLHRACRKKTAAR